jgi:hypothetical protein
MGLRDWLSGEHRGSSPISLSLTACVGYGFNSSGRWQTDGGWADGDEVKRNGLLLGRRGEWIAPVVHWGTWLSLDDS